MGTTNLLCVKSKTNLQSKLRRLLLCKLFPAIINPHMRKTMNTFFSFITLDATKYELIMAQCTDGSVILISRFTEIFSVMYALCFCC